MKKIFTLLIFLSLWLFQSQAATVQIGTGTTTTSYFPLYSCFGYSYSQQIYLGSEITAGGGIAGNITKIRFYYATSTTTTNWLNWTVYLGNTTKTTFASSTDWVASSAMTQVFTGNITVPAVGNWLEITFSTPFAYTGGNLVVAVDENTSGYNCTAGWGSFASGSNRGIEYYSDGTNPDPASPPTANYGPNASINRVQFDMATNVASLTVTPSSATFGYIAYPGTSTTSTYTLSGVNLTSSPIAVAAPTGFEVSLDGTTWSSSVNVAFTPPTLANTTIYTHFKPAAANTGYSGNITNTGGGANAQNFAVSGSSDLFSLYCSSIPSNTTDEEIYSVTVNGTSTPAAYAGTNGCSTAAPGAGSILNRYSNFRSLGSFTNLARTTSIAFTVEENECDGSTYYSNGCAIWVDWNQDGDWLDAGEQVFVESATTISPRNITGSFVVPAGATLGQTGMRIIVAEGYSGTGLTPCMTYSYGETEDYIVTITEAPACPNPASLLATNIAAHTADLSWTEQGTAASWEVEWGTNGFTQGTGTIINVNTAPNTSLNGLNPTTAYAYYVRANCGDNYSPWSGPKSFTTTVACPAPTAGTTTSIATTSAVLGWTNPGGTAWNIEYGLNGFSHGSGTVISGVTENPYTLSGLVSSTAYQWYVQTDCGEEGASTWAGPYSFTTLCETFIAPYEQHFNTTTIPVCWSISGPQNWLFTTTWPAYGAAGITDHTGTSGSFAGVDGSGTIGLNGITLLSPYIDVNEVSNPRVRFFMFNNNTSSTNLTDEQSLSVDLWDGAAWNTGAFVWAMGQNAAGWQEKMINLSGYTITGPIQLRFVVNKASSSPYYDDIAIDDIFVEATPTCPNPTVLAAGSLTAHTASLSWTAGGTETSWEVEYGANGFAQGTGTLIAPATNPQVITGLTAATNYQFYVRANCGTDYSIWAGPKSFTTTIACPAPTAGTATNITTTSADLGWTDASGAAWNIEYGPTGFTQGTGTVISGITTLPYNLSGLTSSSTYKFYVQTDCGEEGTSTWAGPYTFTTLCQAITTFPWTEGFEGITTVGSKLLPACWTYANVSGTSGPTSSNTTGTYYGPHNGTKFIYTNYSNTTWAFTPQMHLTAGTSYDFSFYMMNKYVTSPIDFLMDVSYGATNTNAGMTNALASGVVCSNTSYQLFKYTFTPAATGDYYFGVKTTSTTSTPWYVSFDDFTMELTPACPAPNTLTASSVTAHTASLGWTAGGTESSWQVEYGTNGFTQGTGTLINPATNPQTISGLTASTAYSYYVRANCGGTYSTWAGPQSFTTTVACPAPTAGTTTNVTTSTADIDWTDATGAAWNIEYGPSGFTQGTGTMITGATSHPHTLTDLNSSTTYQWYVQTNCGGEGTSTWAGPYSFTTTCVVTIAPFTENFEITPPACWTVSGGTYDWGISSAASGYGTGTSSAIANFFSINDATPFYLYSPHFDMSSLTAPIIKFDYAYAAYSSSYTDNMNLMYSTDGGATFSLLKAYTGGVSGSLVTAPATTSSFVPTATQWASDSVTLPAGTNMIAFEAISNNGNNLYIDNVKVFEHITNKTLNLTLLLEGLYNASAPGTMHKAQGYDGDFNVVDQYPGTVADVVTVELHNTTAPYALAYEYSPINLNTDGTLTIPNLPATITGSYYIAVKHRNSIQTWSADPVDFSGAGPFTFNFMLDAANTYGYNVKDMLDGYFAIYGGDVDQDGGIGSLDMGMVDNESVNFGGGYIPEDVDGDGGIGSLDMGMIDNNASAFVGYILPGAKKIMIPINK